MCYFALEMRSTFGRISVPKATLFPKILNLAALKIISVDLERRKTN